MQHDMLFPTDNNGIQSQYPDYQAHHLRTFLKQHFLDMSHSNASYILCYMGHIQILPVNRVNRQYFILMSATYANRMSA